MSDEMPVGYAELFRMIGRVEKVVDTMDTKLDGQNEIVARHDVRIANLERGQQRGWERFVLWLTVIVALIASLIAALPALIHH